MRHDEPFSLDEPDVIPLESAPPDRKRLVCRMCFARRLEADAPCPKCGFHERTGLRPSTIIGKRSLGKKGLTCATCGYDLTGLPSPRCPECGTVASPQTRREYDRQVSREVARATYRTPLLMILIAGGLLAGVLFFMHGPAIAGLSLLRYVIEVPIGVIVFLFCCMLWIGFDAPIHLTALRLTGIYMVVDLVGVFTSFLPFVGWLIPLFLYVGLLAELLELDLNDAIIVGVATFFVKLIAAMGLIAAFGLG